MNFWSGVCVVLWLVIGIVFLVLRSRNKKITKLETKVINITENMKKEVTSAKVKADARMNETKTKYDVERKQSEQEAKIVEADKVKDQTDFYNSMIEGFNK